MTKDELTKLAISWVCPVSNCVSSGYEKRMVEYMVSFALYVLAEERKPELSEDMRYQKTYR
jgi:hypothetical protein